MTKELSFYPSDESKVHHELAARDGQHIVVCIVTFRNVDDVLECLKSLAKQTYHQFEVIICENGGPDAFAALTDRIPDFLDSGQPVVAVADHSNPGYAGGVNRCIAFRPNQAGYWVLNPDTLPSPAALGSMVAMLSTGDAVGGPIVLPDGRIQTCGGRWRPCIAYSSAIAKGVPLFQCPDPMTVEKSLSFISGASLLVSGQFIKKAGVMREDYFLYGEEVEWCLRAAALGLRLRFCKDAVVMHHQGTTTGSAGDISQQGQLPIFCDERNRILTLRDTSSSIGVAFGTVGALLLILYRYPRRSAFRSMRFALAGWWSGVRDQRGKPSWLELRESRT